MNASRALKQGSTSFWTKIIVFLAALGLLVGAPVLVRAQGACGDPANRTLNCDFATDISGWVQEIGSNFSHSPDGNVGPGSIEVQSQPGAPDDIAKINQCVGGLAGLSSVDVGASFRIAAGSPYSCGVEATKYSDDNCTTNMGSSGYYNEVFASRWARIGGTFDLDPTIRGIRISPICFSMTGVFSIRIDDIYLGKGVGAIIFNDGFESGSTSVWSGGTQSPPDVEITGPSSLDPGDAGVLDGSGTTDPDGDPFNYSWTVRSASSPFTDCAADWITGPTNGATLDIQAPVAAINPECADSVIFWLEADDGEDVGVGSHGVVVNTAPPAGHTLSASDRTMTQGSYNYFFVNVSPSVVAPDTYDWDWSTVAESGGCSDGDISLSSGWESGSGSGRRFDVDPSTTGCVFLVTVTLDINSGGEIVTTQFRITVTNHPPEATVVGVSETSPDVFEITLPPGFAPSFTAEITDPDGWTPDMDYSWSGDLSEVTCSPSASCFGIVTGSSDNHVTITFDSSPTLVGSPYTFTLQVTDQDAVSSILLIVHIEPCLYVGSTPGSPTEVLGTFLNPYLSIQDAIDDAVAMPDTNVCVIEGTYPEDVLVRYSGTNTPIISGGYSAVDGSPLMTNREDASIIENIDVDGITFESGADNLVEFLTVRQSGTVFAVGAAAAVTIDGASPTLSNLVVSGGAGDPAVGVDVLAGVGDASPTVNGCQVVGSDRVAANDVYGIRVQETGGEVDPLIQGGAIQAGDGTGLGVGVGIGPGADAAIDGAEIRDCDFGGCDFAQVVGIDAQGVDGNRASFELRDSQVVLYYAAGAEDAFGVRLHRTDGVLITGSDIRGEIGTRAGVAIADGNVYTDGTLVDGGSTHLTIEDNPAIIGMGPFTFDSGCTGTRFAVGILLVGSTNVLIQDNVASHLMGSDGIRGGNAIYHHDWATDRLPPTTSGLWLVNTDGVEVLGNTIANGSLSGNDLCPKPVPFPVMNGMLDGLPSYLGFAPGSSSGALLVDMNTIVCAINPENGAGPTLGFTSCVGADMQGSRDAVLTNNILASLSANVNVAVRFSGGSSLDLVNNLLDADFIMMGPPPDPEEVFKYALLVDEIGVDALRAHNNIIYVREDDPYDNPDELLPLRELVDGSTVSSIEAFTHNLLYIEGDLLSTTSTPMYARVIDITAGRVDYTPLGINMINGIADNNNNLVDLPGLLEPADQMEKDLIRLDPTSAAVNNGRDNVAPDHDIDGDPRTEQVDIGHDEISLAH